MRQDFADAVKMIYTQACCDFVDHVRRDSTAVDHSDNLKLLEVLEALYPDAIPRPDSTPA